MPLLSALVTRIQWYLQDYVAGGDGEVWQRAQLREQLRTESERLARRGLFGEVVGMQGVSGKRTYPLNEQSLLITSATENGAAASLTDATDSTLDFVALGVQAGDRVRNLTDGCTGEVTAVAPTVLTCLGLFRGGVANAMTPGDQFLVERPLSAFMVIGVQDVLYHGKPLLPITERGQDRLRPGWEQDKGGPKYWSVDNQRQPTVIEVLPPPVFDGSTVPVFPAVPLALPLAYNLVVFCTVEPQSVYDEVSVSAWPTAWEDVLVFQAVAETGGSEGHWQNLSVSTVMEQLAALWRRQLGEK